MSNINPIVESYETLVYKTKGTIKMFWCFLSSEQKYMVILRPWSDQTPPMQYLDMTRSGIGLPKNVKLLLSDDPKELSAEIEAFEPAKSTYKRKRKPKTQTPTL